MMMMMMENKTERQKRLRIGSGYVEFFFFETKFWNNVRLCGWVGVSGQKTLLSENNSKKKTNHAQDYLNIMHPWTERLTNEFFFHVLIVLSASRLSKWIISQFINKDSSHHSWYVVGNDVHCYNMVHHFIIIYLERKTRLYLCFIWCVWVVCVCCVYV